MYTSVIDSVRSVTGFKHVICRYIAVHVFSAPNDRFTLLNPENDKPNMRT